MMSQWTSPAIAGPKAVSNRHTRIRDADARCRLEADAAHGSHRHWSHSRCSRVAVVATCDHRSNAIQRAQRYERCAALRVLAYTPRVFASTATRRFAYAL